MSGFELAICQWAADAQPALGIAIPGYRPSSPSLFSTLPKVSLMRVRNTEPLRRGNLRQA